MKIGLAQLNPTVGDIVGNSAKILHAYRFLAAEGAALVLTPELAIPGYPPQDLVFKSRFVPENLAALEALAAQTGSVPLITGYIDVNTGSGKPYRNAAAVLQDGRIIARIFKSLLPSYDVFDEDRYFEPASSTEVIELCGVPAGVTICEDIWTEPYLSRKYYGASPLASLVEKGARMILNLSASPYSMGKAPQRLKMLSSSAAEHAVSIYYCNACGGNDELIFDGNSMAVDAHGSLMRKLSSFQEEHACIDSEAGLEGEIHFDETPAELFKALSLGLRDYILKCGFKSAVLGLSGGIDSALVACIAVDALGSENVCGVTMPTQYSSSGSIGDSRLLAKRLGMQLLEIPIQRAFDAVRAQFSTIFADLDEDTTEENIQPRLRGLTLMALSNKFGHLLLSTGNKSELSVGYCTLYGDMCGGLAVISDVPKTMVYRLAKWINRDREIIPADTISKPPSAELKPDQLDQDSLPPYEVLDPILQLYVEEELSATEIITRGFDEELVRWIIRKVDTNEYKRAQAVPGLKVTSRAFGQGRRMPVAQRFI